MTTTTNNPLLSPTWLPHFQAIKPADLEPAIRQILGENQAKLVDLLKQPREYTWNNLMLPLEEMNERLSQAWSPASHLHSVMQSDTWRDAYNACLPLITEYHTLLMQHQPLFQAIEALSKSKDFNALDFAQQKTIENELRDFRLAGVHLSAEKKVRFLELEQKLSELTTRFSENLLDATQAWFLPITDKEQLAGLPDSACELAAKQAQQRKLDGWALTLDFPSYSAAIKYLDNRDLRKSLYEAYCTRASDQGPGAGKWDNSTLMTEIIDCRHQLAHLVDFANYAEYSLTTKMAKQPAIVMDFLYQLLGKSKPFAEKEIAELKQFIKSLNGPEDIAPWDLSYYGEKCRLSKFNFSEEEIKPYFPIDKVRNGLFTLVNKIFGITITERTDVETWHPEVKFFDIHDEQGEYRGGFYLDLYARPSKREGAWMDDCRSRRRLSDQTLQYPVAYLVCNFTPPLNSTPALLTHDEVLTLFHEFGHGLHHMLTKIDSTAVSGIHGVPWDVVEFPSQFMELWFWEHDILRMISGHYQTNEPLPDHLHHQLLAAKNFHSGLHMIRQVEFALFDFRMHNEYAANKPNFIGEILAEVRKSTALIPVPDYNRFQNSFAHIFSGGYAAGYYSYAWADVLSCDAYGKFEENGLLSRETGKSFMQNILEIGGAKDLLDAFVKFRGHKPEMDALLRQNGWG